MDVQIDGVSMNQFGYNAIIDSGSSLIWVPTTDYDDLIDMFFALDKQCELDGTAFRTLYCVCDTIADPDFPTFSFVFNQNQTFYLDPADYLLDVGYGYCLSTFADNEYDSDYWLLGDSFMRAFYTIHDITNQRIGLVG
jgi:hypothetical protein